MCAHIQNPDQVLDRERQCETKKQLLESEAHREHQCGLGETLFFSLPRLYFKINRHLIFAIADLSV